LLSDIDQTGPIKLDWRARVLVDLPGRTKSAGPPSENYPSCYRVEGRRGCADRANQFDPFAPSSSRRPSTVRNRLRLKI